MEKSFLYDVKDKTKQQDIIWKAQENIRNKMGCKGIIFIIWLLVTQNIYNTNLIKFSTTHTAFISLNIGYDDKRVNRLPTTWKLLLLLLLLNYW
jgi:hypothetical protein